MPYHALRRLVGQFGHIPEKATIPPSIPKSLIKRWLQDKVIAAGRGEREADLTIGEGKMDVDEFGDSEPDIDIDHPEFDGTDEDDIEVPEEPEPAPAPAAARPPAARPPAARSKRRSRGN